MSDRLRDKIDSNILLSRLGKYKFLLTLLLSLSFLTGLVDGVSITLFVPLLGSLQQVDNYDQFPVFLRNITQFFTSFPFEQQILYLVSILVGILVIKNIFMAISIHIGYRLTSRLIADLRTQAVKLLLTVDVAYYNRTQIGELIDNILSSTHRTEVVVKSTTELLINIILFIFLLGLMFVLAWELTLVTLFCSIFILLVFSWYTGKMAKLSKQELHHRIGLSSQLAENISGIFVIKYFSKEKQQLAKLQNRIEANSYYHLWQQTGTSLISNLSEILGTIMIGVLIVFTMLISDLSNPATVTKLLAFIYILIRLFPVLKEINRTRVLIASNWSYIDHVAQLIKVDDKPFLRDGTRQFSQLKQGICFQSVTFQYNSEHDNALTDIDLFIPRQQITAIIGDSGSGKSTMVNLLLRLYDPQQGLILIDDIPLNQFEVITFRQHIGIVSQDVFLFNDTIYNNIAFGAENPPTEEDVINAAKQAGAHEFIMESPEGYQSNLGERGIRLSGGQRQRISIARAILKDPPILILDEATSSLDSRTEAIIHQAITQFSRNRTVIIIAHRLSTIRDANQVIVLKSGHITAIEDAQTIFNKLDDDKSDNI